MSMFVSDKVYCDSYYCPDHYKLVDNADDIYCKDKKCTKDQCCKKGEEYHKNVRCARSTMMQSVIPVNWKKTIVFCWRSFRV